MNWKVMSIAAALLVCASPALAAEATPAPTPAASPAAAPAATPPSPAALALAIRILTATGIRGTLDALVPDLLTKLEANVVRAHPEAKDAIHDVVFSLAKEFGSTEKGPLDAVATTLASQMSEADMTTAATFFESDAYKKYRTALPAVLRDLDGVGKAWAQRLNVDVMNRAREEMKKKGFDI